MLRNHNIAFIDFDKTLYDLVIPDFEQKRKELAQKVKDKFGIETQLYPILEDTEKIAVANKAVGAFIHECIDEIEFNATGYFYLYAENVLNKIADQMPIVIVSNNSAVLIRNKLKEFNLARYVKYVYGRDTYSYYKPSGKVLEYCCSQIEIPPSGADKFLFIGDGWRDYDCAFGFAKKNNLSYTFIHAKLLEQIEIL